MIDTSVVILYFSIITSSSYFLGRIFLGTFSPNFESFVVRTLFFIAGGVAFFTSFLFIIAVVSIDYWTILFVIITIHGIGIFSIKTSILRLFSGGAGSENKGSSIRSMLWKRSRFKDIILLAVIIAQLAHIVYVVDYLKWPPAGDAIRHGLITSLAMNNNHLSLNFEPIAPQKGIETPTGYHAMAAHLGSLLKIYPGESVFVLAAFFTWFILVAIFILAYRITGSFPLAIVASLFALAINYTGNLETWIMGYFYNGPYPNLAGFVLVISSLMIWAEQNKLTTRQSVLIHGITSFSILVTYPLFIIFPAFFWGTRYILSRIRKREDEPIHNKSNLLRAHYKKIIILAIVALYGGSIIAPALSESLSNSTVLSTFGKVTQNPNYLLPSDYFNKNAFGILSALALIVAVYFLLYTRHTYFSSIYILTSLLIFSSLFIQDLSFILPRRSAIILDIFAWIMLLLGGREITKSQTVSSYLARVHHRLSRFNPSEVIVASLMVSFIILPSLYSHASGEAIHKYDWFSRDGQFLNDYQVIEWIAKNTTSNDLILNDFSFTSEYISSFAIKNLTYPIIVDNNATIDRATDAMKFWKKPSDLCFLKQIATKYGIKYVYSTGEWAYRDLQQFGGDDGHYKAKPFNRKVVNQQFSESPMLEPIIVKDLAGLYRIKNLDAIVCG